MPELNMGLSPAEFARREEYEKKCTSCGACCCFYAATPAKIGADGFAARDPHLSYQVTITRESHWQNAETELIVEDEQVMKTKILHDFPACIALEGLPGEHVMCSIYEDRPHQCRLFMAGSNMCLTARRWAGFE
jgi:Fe-S-cluster containining protein